MKQVLIFSDSVCQGLERLNFDYSEDDESSIVDRNIIFHEESYPGATASACVQSIKNNSTFMNLKQLLYEKDYDGVVICFGTNDIGYNSKASDVAKDLQYLQNVCIDAGIKLIVLMMMRAKKRYMKLNEILVEDTFHVVELCEFLFNAHDSDFDDSEIHLTDDAKKKLYDELARYAW